MREIKFRAWDENLVEPIMYKNWDDLMHTEGLILMQFTGLKDKNGKEIYEGDIIQRYVDEIFEVRWEELHSGFGVYIGEINFRAGWRELSKFGHFEIIGNIYENRELLANQ